jgi:glycosyltransferase involved in cell wall biosynthesis
MPALKIAYVINSIEGGGAAMPVPAIARAISEVGAEMHILALTGRDRRALPAMLAAGIDVHVRPDGEGDHFSALRWLNRAVGFLKPDIIWTSLTRATLLGQLVGAHRRIPVVSWQHAAFLRPANKRLLRFARSRSAFWIADSCAVNEFTQRQLGVSADKVVTWPLFAADPDAPQAPAWRPGQKVRVGSLGRLHPVKGYDVLIRALAKLSVSAPDDSPEIEVVICGEGGDRSRLTDLARETGVSILSLSGFCAEPRQFLAGLHLYVQPSKSEGFCVAAHEAMQAGVPVIASTVGELARSVKSGQTGLLVPPGDPAALADAIQSCVSRPETLKTMGDAGRARLLSCFSDTEFRRGAGEIVGRLEQLSRAS